MAKKITFYDTGKLKSVDKRYLKKDEQGYFIKDNSLIHYFDKNKNYENSKIYVGKN